jgi:hypothetical protein
MRWRLRLVKLLLWGLALLAAYIALGFGLGAVAVNKDFTETPNGIKIWLVTNGMHTSVILPVADKPYPWTMVGWGDAEFFQQVPEWTDLTLPLACGSAFARHATALRYEEIYLEPYATEDVRTIRISADQFVKLQAYIEATATQVNGVKEPLVVANAPVGTTYYAAQGRYHIFRTCNQWTSDALDAAGIRHGLWTPFAPSVMRHFR